MKYIVEFTKKDGSKFQTDKPFTSQLSAELFAMAAALSMPSSKPEIYEDEA